MPPKLRRRKRANVGGKIACDDSSELSPYFAETKKTARSARKRVAKQRKSTGEREENEVDEGFKSPYFVPSELNLSEESSSSNEENESSTSLHRTTVNPQEDDSTFCKVAESNPIESKAEAKAESTKEEELSDFEEPVKKRGRARGGKTRKGTKKSRRRVGEICRKPPQKESAKAEKAKLTEKEEKAEKAASSDSDMEWEEVAPAANEEGSFSKVSMNENIEITVESKRSKSEGKKSELEKALEKHHREVQANMHKVELLCLVAVLRQRNQICNNELLQALCLSLLPEKYMEISGQSLDVAVIKDVVIWFNSVFQLVPSAVDARRGHMISIYDELAEKRLSSPLHVAMVFLAILRAMGLPSRLVSLLQPVPLKWVASKGENTEGRHGSVESPADKKMARTKQKKRKRKERVSYKDSNSEEEGKEEGRHKPKRKGDNDYQPLPSESQADDAVSSKDKDGNESSGNDFQDPPEPKKSTRKKEIKRRSSGGGSVKQRKRLSTNEGVIDHWVEVYVETDLKWICVSPLVYAVDDIESIRDNAGRFITYVLSADNDGAVKDVTCRYSSDWMTGARKRRVDDEWWPESLQLYKAVDEQRDEEEDKQLQACLEKLPFPKSISDFKNHPLYALKRHLLKFEAIYPEDAPVLGYTSKGKEPIYPRECVKQLHARETWLKDAKSVKPGEKAYKIVKKRPKRNDQAHLRNQLRLEIFGEWQVEEYVSPPAKDGKVPRNAYGNVELFKPCMLPAGAVHMTLPNIQKVARKLDIDHAQAMMGWDFHCGWCIPVFDGIVVCCEFEDVLIEAWEQQREEMEKKAVLKREKVIYERWKKLIKALLIVDRLKRKYKEFTEEASGENDGNGKPEIRKWGQIAGVGEQSLGALKLPGVP